MDLLISEVKKRNVLWNRCHCSYRDKSYTEREWEEVAEAVGITKEDAKKKWRNLRDQFIKELKKYPNKQSISSQDQASIHNRKWQHFNSLLFLKDLITPKERKENLSLMSDSTTSAFEQYDDEVSNAGSNNTADTIYLKPQSSDKLSPNLRKRSRTDEIETDIELKILDIESKKLALLTGTEDENALFLRSLLPFMRRLDPLQQLRVRTSFQNILLAELMETVNTEETD